MVVRNIKVVAPTAKNYDKYHVRHFNSLLANSANYALMAYWALLFIKILPTFIKKRKPTV